MVTTRHGPTATRALHAAGNTPPEVTGLLAALRDKATSRRPARRRAALTGLVALLVAAGLGLAASGGDHPW